MRRVRDTRRLITALVAAVTCGVGMSAALAAPPLAKVSLPAAHESTARADVAGAGVSQRHLDLTLPRTTSSVMFERAGGAVFPGAARHGMDAHDEAATTTSDPRLSAPAAHVMSRAETLAHNFRREGLPVAKLFQSDTALVHLGLSPKGKPGLWIVEKIR